MYFLKQKYFPFLERDSRFFSNLQGTPTEFDSFTMSGAGRQKGFWNLRWLGWISFVLLSSSSNSLRHHPKCVEGTRPRRGDGCWHVYLDVGSNIGVQVRKLFEPHLYPGALVLDLFESRFHIDRLKPVPLTVINPHFTHNTNLTSHICAFGWEPNPQHTDWLHILEIAYHQNGWRTKFLTETAVGVSDEEKATFYFHKGNLGWQTTIFPTWEHLNEGGEKADIPYFDLSRFVLDEIVDRALPPGESLLQ